MSRDYLKMLKEQARQRARVRYIEDKAHTLVPLTFSQTAEFHGPDGETGSEDAGIPGMSSKQRWDDALAMAVDLAGRLFDKLPEIPTEDDAVSKPSTPASNHCPKCDSPDPGRHPAMQAGGEVQICSHPFHGAGR